MCTGTESRTGTRTCTALLYRYFVPVYRAVAEVSLVDTFPSPPPPSLSLASLSCFKAALLERNQTDQSGGEIGDHESHDTLITVFSFNSINVRHTQVLQKAYFLQPLKT